MLIVSFQGVFFMGEVSENEPMWDADLNIEKIEIIVFVCILAVHKHEISLLVG